MRDDTGTPADAGKAAAEADKMLGLLTWTKRGRYIVSSGHLQLSLRSDGVRWRPYCGARPGSHGHIPLDEAVAWLAGQLVGILDVCRTVDPRRTALEDAADRVAELCGCPDWWYPAQLARDVEAVVKARDAALAAATLPTVATVADPHTRSAFVGGALEFSPDWMVWTLPDGRRLTVGRHAGQCSVAFDGRLTQTFDVEPGPDFQMLADALRRVASPSAWDTHHDAVMAAGRAADPEVARVLGVLDAVAQEGGSR